MTKPRAICDTECYPNFWSIGFKRIHDGKVVVMEKSARKELDTARLLNIMKTHEIVTYNGLNYDMGMIFLAISGASNAELKQANDKIILGGLKSWQVEEALGIKIPRGISHIDLIEPQPNAFASLKTLAGRLHAPKMQDLPYSPDSVLTEEQMDNVLAYMGNDLDNTHLLLDGLDDALELRAALGAEYGMNFMSKSDSQIGEAILKKRVQEATGERVEKVRTPAGTSFPFKVPDYLVFQNPTLQQVTKRLRETQFYVKEDGKVQSPAWLSDISLTIGETSYSIGIGGLHSMEKARAVHSDEDYILIDFDVASYYPKTILNSGLYPVAFGPAFLPTYRGIRDTRVVAKHQAADSSLPADARRTAQTEAEGLKISLNGVYGKLGSPYSALYAPHLMIATTLTGQLAILMLIDRAEAAGIPVVSANTDGVVFRCPRHMAGEIKGVRVLSGLIRDIVEQWERDTDYELEATEYKSLYNASVNSYIAVKPNGKVKIKGVLADPWRDGDKREILKKNPQMTVVSKAVVDHLTKGIPIEETIYASRNIREFVTVVNVKGGGTWRGEYLGKVVRYYWGKDGEPIYYLKPDPRTGTCKRVSNSDGSRPLMDLPAAMPGDIDHDAYIAAAYEALKDYGAVERPAPIKPLRVYKYNALLWFAVAA